MNIEKELEEFYSQLDYKPLSFQAIALYGILLIVAKKAGWPDEIKLTNSFLLSKLRMNISTFQRARNELVNNNYIIYKKRNKSNR